MPIKITIAKTPELIDEVFKIRHKVYVEEEKLLQATVDERLMDRFDAYPTTNNLVVTTGGQIVGSLRMTLDSPVGMPVDDSYDFRDFLPPNHRAMSCSLFCVSRSYNHSKITMGLLLMAGYFSEFNAVTHIVALVGPNSVSLFEETGFRVIGDEFVEPIIKLPVLPLVLNTYDFNDFFIQFARKNQLLDFLGEYERFFYNAGEFIVRAGEEGECAFVIIEGIAHVKVPHNEKIIGVLEAGEVFGELALLTREKRSADIIAATDVQVMTLTRDIFIKQFVDDPERTFGLLRLMGERTRKLIEQLEQSMNTDA